jgi:hypothetical protein
MPGGENRPRYTVVVRFACYLNKRRLGEDFATITEFSRVLLN